MIAARLLLYTILSRRLRQQACTLAMPSSSFALMGRPSGRRLRNLRARQLTWIRVAAATQERRCALAAPACTGKMITGEQSQSRSVHNHIGIQLPGFGRTACKPGSQLLRSER